MDNIRHIRPSAVSGKKNELRRKASGEYDGKLQRDAMFQLVDQYTLFYLHFRRAFNSGNPDYWSANMESAGHRAWSGYAFEQV